MTFDLSTAMDFFSALALLSLLASSYGWLKRALPHEHHAQIALGVLFGLITVLQMNLPLRPFPGTVIDLRAIPLVLAGSYLGWRGALACTLIALATRLSLGGVGMAAGLAGIVLSTPRRAHLAPPRARGPVAHLAVARRAGRAVVGQRAQPAAAHALASAVDPHAHHAVPVGHLPDADPLFALLMQREDTAMWIERQLKASASTDPATGLLNMEAFGRAAAIQAGSETPTAGTGLVILRIRHDRWITQVHGEGALDTVRSALRARLEERLPEGDVLGRTPSGCIAMLLADRSGPSSARLTARIARDLSTRPIRLADGGELRVSLDMGTTWEPDRRPLSELLTEAAHDLERNAAMGGLDVSTRRAGRHASRDAAIDGMPDPRS